MQFGELTGSGFALVGIRPCPSERSRPVALAIICCTGTLSSSSRNRSVPDRCYAAQPSAAEKKPCLRQMQAPQGQV